MSDDFAAALCHPPVTRLVAVGEVARIFGQPSAGRRSDETVLPACLANVLRVLEIERVVDEIPFGRKFTERKHIERAGCAAGVCHAQPPDFVLGIQRNKIKGFRADARIIARDQRIARTKAGFGLVVIEWLLRSLPRCGPEIAAGRITDIKLPPWQIHRDAVVAVTQDAAFGRRAGEAVTACAGGDDAAVFA